MSYTIVRPKDHNAWLEERKKGLGSSDAGTVMGVSPFSTPLKLWRLKLGLDPPIPESDSMRNGHFLEPAVAEYFASVTKSTIDYSSEGDWLAVDNEKPWLRVSPDRLFWPEGVEHRPEKRCILEIKSTSKFVDPDNLPLYWLCQVQYQMGIMGIEVAAIAWITSQPRLEMGYAWIRFNPGFFKSLVLALDTFWNENILKKVEPPALTSEDCKIKWPTSESDKIIVADDQDVFNCKEWTRLTAERDSINEQIGQLEASIKIKLQDAETLISVDRDTGKTRTIARFKSINETVLDEERFRNEMPEEYVKYLEKVFNKQLFKEEDKINFGKYSHKQKGYRRFSVLAS